MDALLAEGATIAVVSRQFQISRDSIRRHRAAHLAPGVLDQIESTRGAVSIATRLREIADGARAVRLGAAAQSNALLAIRGGDAETRALIALASHLGIEHEAVVDQIDEAVAIIRAIRRLTPDHGEAVVQALAATGSSDLASIWAEVYNRQRTTMKGLRS